ncbi:MAG TPA: patatin-like phospholipase family protein, partial [Spirochaetia bacterium]|nr:patatin-like phospholipase family protein [Spirochaetia bacterium]
MCFFKRKKRVGLVLGSGGARGLAHIGVIKALVNNNIPIDLIVGSSSGALIGGLFASWGEIGDLEKMARGITYKDIAEVLIDPTWNGGLIKGNKTIEYLRNIFDDKKIEDLKIPFAAVATDVNTAETVVFDRGDMVTAVRASVSVPLVYSPVQVKGRLLVDGGVSCPVPVEIAKKMGAEVIIAVNLDGVYFSGNNHKVRLLSSTIDVLKDSYFALRYNLAKKEM